MNEPQNPGVGRIVHFYERAYDHATDKFGELTGPHAAIITRVWGPTCVNLQVLFDNSSVAVRTSVVFDARDVPGSSHTWKWPPRV